MVEIQPALALEPGWNDRALELPFALERLVLPDAVVFRATAHVRSVALHPRQELLAFLGAHQHVMWHVVRRIESAADSNIGVVQAEERTDDREQVVDGLLRTDQIGIDLNAERVAPSVVRMLDLPELAGEVAVTTRFGALGWGRDVPQGELALTDAVVRVPVDQQDFRPAVTTGMVRRGQVEVMFRVSIFPDGHRSPEGERMVFVGGKLDEDFVEVIELEMPGRDVDSILGANAVEDGADGINDVGIGRVDDLCVLVEHLPQVIISEGSDARIDRQLHLVIGIVFRSMALDRLDEDAAEDRELTLPDVGTGMMHSAFEDLTTFDRIVGLEQHLVHLEPVVENELGYDTLTDEADPVARIHFLHPHDKPPCG